ncbi:MAG: DUF3604 domain-containing protein [Chloroflexota bacterium]
MRLTSGVPGQSAVWHMANMELEDRLIQHGRGRFEMPQPVVAGTYTTVTFTFEIGEMEIPSGGRLRVAWRWPFDWTPLQTGDPQADGYLGISAPAGVEIKADYQPYGDLNPWMHHLELTVTQGGLKQGDQVQLICGDRASGGRGWRAPTFTTHTAGFLMLLNPDNQPRWIQLPDTSSFAIIAGPPTKLVVITPSEGVVGEPVPIIVRAEDQWGNPTPLLDDKPQLSTLSDQTVTILETNVPSDLPVYHFEATFDQPGDTQFIASASNLERDAHSNPLYIHATRPTWQPFWGDLHGGQTDIGCGAGTLADHYSFARDVAGLCFTSQQANDHYVSLDDWNHAREVTPTFDEPGRFAAFLGCEWSPLTEDGGDRNVIYQHDEPRLRRSGRFFTETSPDPEPDLPTAPEFLAVMRTEPVLINMHVGGRPTNLDYHAPEIEPLAEIHSTHGTSEWFVLDALQRGYKIGITAGTDGVMARPGACVPSTRVVRNVRSGLTAVYATELTQAALWEAFQARRCYATDGERIRLWLDVDGHPMGSEFKTDGCPQINLKVEGTAAIERVDLLRGTSSLCSWQVAQPQPEAIRVLWSGTERQGTAKDQRVVWDGALSIGNGQILTARSVGFQSPDDEVQVGEDGTVSWRSVTAGNNAGLILTLDGDATTTGSFSTVPSTFDFTLNQIRLAPLVVDAGGASRQVSIGPAPAEDGPRQIDLQYRDSQPLTGTQPYWVRVIQVNRSKAWSSPVYVTR